MLMSAQLAQASLGSYFISLTCTSASSCNNWRYYQQFYSSLVNSWCVTDRNRKSKGASQPQLTKSPLYRICKGRLVESSARHYFVPAGRPSYASSVVLNTKIWKRHIKLTIWGDILGDQKTYIFLLRHDGRFHCTIKKAFILLLKLKVTLLIEKKNETRTRLEVSQEWLLVPHFFSCSLISSAASRMMQLCRWSCFFSDCLGWAGLFQILLKLELGLNAGLASNADLEDRRYE